MNFVARSRSIFLFPVGRAKSPTWMHRVGLSPDGKDEQVDPEKTATVRQARALLDDARLKLDRARSLLEKGVIAQVWPKVKVEGHAEEVLEAARKL